MNFLKNAMLFILMAVPLQMNAIVPAKPIKILMVSGGCYHDYITQTRVLIDSLNKYIYNIDWQSLNTNESCDEIVPLMTSKDWGKGYDLIIYNICWATIVDTAYINNLCRIHHEHGINAIVLHCTMHTFRDAQADTWREFLGVETHVHAAAGKIFVRNVNPGHPVMKDFPAFWTTPVDD